jgi:hypothetical protein
MDLSNISDLQTKGYAVIRGFLSADDIERLRLDYEVNRMRTQQHKNFKTVFSPNNHGLADRIQQVLTAVHEHTDIRADTVRPQGVYFATDMDTFTWHQDTEWYFLYQDSYDILNFWMPVIKPEHDRSGLRLVPYDRLLAVVPEFTRQHLLRKGAKQFTVLDRERVSMLDLSDDSTHILDIDFDVICDTPEVGLGDVIVKRSDTIHQTQDSDTYRVAYSTRCINSQAVVSRSVLMTGGEHKHRVLEQLNKTLAMYQRMIQTFERKQSDTITVADILDSEH